MDQLLVKSVFVGRYFWFYLGYKILETLVPYLDELKNREINSAAELEKWMQDRSELESTFSEEMGGQRR